MDNPRFLRSGATAEPRAGLNGPRRRSTRRYAATEEVPLKVEHLGIKIAISGGALAVIGARLLWPELRLDGVTLGLIAVGILPWLSALIKSAELPGGWKIEFQEVQAAGAKVTRASPPPLPSADIPRPSYLDISDRDPNLALVGLRIEIEKRLRALGEKYDLRENRSIIRMFGELRQRGILNDPSVSGLQELVMAGNQAAHGAEVDPRAAAWAIDYGPQILAVLDARLANLE